jgi:hypothetical protein
MGAVRRVVERIRRVGIALRRTGIAALALAAASAAGIGLCFLSGSEMRRLLDWIKRLCEKHEALGREVNEVVPGEPPRPV